MMATYETYAALHRSFRRYLDAQSAALTKLSEAQFRVPIVPFDGLAKLSAMTLRPATRFPRLIGEPRVTAET
jgi:hypothetical protein